MSLDLPSPPPPRLPRPKLNKPTTLFVGCGLGIGAFALLALIAFVAIAVVLPRYLVPRARNYADLLYAKAEVNRNLSKQQLETYGEILRYIDAPGSTIYTVNIGGAVLLDHLKDGAVSDEELKEAADVRDFLAQNPRAGMNAVATFLKAHPTMQDKLQAFSRGVAMSRAAGG